MRHHMMMRLFLGHLLPADDLRALLGDYHDRTADWSAQLREIEAKFAKSLSGPYRDAVFFELLSLRNLIALADFEVSAAHRALKALDRARDASPGNEELPGRLLDIIREYSVGSDPTAPPRASPDPTTPPRVSPDPTTPPGASSDPTAPPS